MASEFALAADDPCEALNESRQELSDALNEAAATESQQPNLSRPLHERNMQIFLNCLAYVLHSGRGDIALQEAFRSPNRLGLEELWSYRFPSSPSLTGRQIYDRIYQFLPAYEQDKKDLRKALLVKFLICQNDWWKNQQDLKRRFIQTQFQIPSAKDFIVWRIPRCNFHKVERPTLYTQDSEIVGRKYAVRSSEKNRQERFRIAELLDSSILSGGILDSTKNYIILDALTNKVVLAVWRGMLGDSAVQMLSEVCEEAFRLRLAGSRGRARAGTGDYVSAGYTLSYAKNMHCRITPISNFKQKVGQDQREEHETAITAMASLLFTTSQRVWAQTPLLQPILRQFDVLYQQSEDSPEEKPAMKLPGIDQGQLGQGQSKTRYQLGGFEFEQNVAKVSNIFFGRCASSPTHVDEDVSPVLLWVAKRKGQYTSKSGGLFYNLPYGIGIPLESNTTVIFYSDQPHGSTVLGDEEILHSMSMSVCHRTLAAVQRFNKFFGNLKSA